MASRSGRNSQSSGQRNDRSVGPRLSLASNASNAKRFLARSASVVSIPGRVTGNNRYGNKGTLKCFDCRRLKRRCEYDNPEDPCEHCLTRGVSCGEKQRSENQVPNVPPTPAPVEITPPTPPTNPPWPRDVKFLDKIMENVDEKMTIYEVINKLLEEITETLESNPNSSELVEKLRALTPEPHGDAAMSQPDEKPIQTNWAPEQPMQPQAQYQPASAPPNSTSTFLYANSFPGLHNPMGQQQGFEMHTQNALQPLVQISGASLPRGPTLTSASAIPTDPQYFNQFQHHNPFGAELPRVAPQAYSAQYLQPQQFIKMEPDTTMPDFMDWSGS